MPLDMILGAQWGDEGKGRITDLLAVKADITARFSGGDNAGHTVTVGSQIYKLHLIPSGIIHPHTLCILGNGMVINPERFIAELDDLKKLGVDISPERLKISRAAHILTPAHIALDGAQESQRGGLKIGTTRRGIGPAYVDKAARRGIRAGAMEKPDTFARLIREHVAAANKLLERIYGQPPLDAEAISARFHQIATRLKPYLADTGSKIAEALEAGKTVLAEGAQGTLLDIDHGSYPYVTSSSPTAPGALLGLGIGPSFLQRIIGVTKAFQTRVGEGPFPTELTGPEGDLLRGTGENPWDEFGTTTGRPRRCGWLDLVLLRYAARVNGFTELTLTKLDILSGISPLQVCTAYSCNGLSSPNLTDTPDAIGSYMPVYTELPGWAEPITSVRSPDKLPAGAQQYIRLIETETNLPVRMVSVGPERDALIHR
ncbi:MAG: adenylosuccinate synthase [Anaerolineales bacterium]|nr:adenylosuccinate synthase [Anaerolineales bacterium]